jgi:Zn-dependent peptidase ImmA (M78 family)
VEKFDDFMKALREVSPFPITFENLQGGAYGYCSPNDKKIVVKKGLSEAQTVKTTIHEITHADLHVSDNSEKKDRSTKEVEALCPCFLNVYLLHSC